VNTTDVRTTQLLRELPDCVLVLTGAGEVLWGNRAAERLFGRSLRESIGYVSLELVHPDDLELVLRSFESVRRKDVGTLIEVRVRTPSGWRLLEVLGAPVEWAEAPDAVLFCMRDLTDRRRFEVARNKDATFRTVVHSSPDLTILLSESGVVESVSGAFSRILGHDPELIEGRSLAGFVVADDQPVFLDALQTAARGATASNPLRVRIRLPRYEDSQPVPFEFAFVNLLDDPSVGGFVISARDITERTMLERELVAHATTAGKLLASLTSREREIMELLDETSSASQIARTLTLSTRTVESHLANAYRKLGVRSRTAAIAEFGRLTRAAAGVPPDGG